VQRIISVLVLVLVLACQVLVLEPHVLVLVLVLACWVLDTRLVCQPSHQHSESNNVLHRAFRAPKLATSLASNTLDSVWSSLISTKYRTLHYLNITLQLYLLWGAHLIMCAQCDVIMTSIESVWISQPAAYCGRILTSVIPLWCRLAFRYLE